MSIFFSLKMFCIVLDDVDYAKTLLDFLTLSQFYGKPKEVEAEVHQGRARHAQWA